MAGETRMLESVVLRPWKEVVGGARVVGRGINAGLPLHAGIDGMQRAWSRATFSSNRMLWSVGA